MLRSKNNKVDALAKLAMSLTYPDERVIQIIVGERCLLPPSLEKMEETYDSNPIRVCYVKEKQE